MVVSYIEMKPVLITDLWPLHFSLGWFEFGFRYVLQEGRTGTTFQEFFTAYLRMFDAVDGATSGHTFCPKEY